jgi:hypothetical protein
MTDTTAKSIHGAPQVDESGTFIRIERRPRSKPFLSGISGQSPRNLFQAPK